MRTVILEGSALYFRLQMIEKQLSHVRKTKQVLSLFNLIFLEEVSVVRQAKREKLPVFAYFSGKAFVNLDDELLFLALEEGVIEGVMEDTPFLNPFMQEAKRTFQWIS